jgi:capsular exopolysaccharide synthesis family protein
MDKHEQFPLNSVERPLVSSVVALQRYQQPDIPVPPYGVEPVDNVESGSALLQYWRILLRHKWFLAAASLAGLLAGALITIPITPVFRADTSLEVLSINDDFMNMRPTQAAIPQADSDNISEEETQAALLQSDSLLNEVAAKLYPDAPPPRKLATSGWRSWFHLREARSKSEKELLLEQASKTLKVINTPRTRVLTVSVDSPDPEFAKTFLDTLVQQFIAENVKGRWDSTKQTSQWLTQELADARNKLQQSETALQNYAQKADLFFTDQESQTNVATEKLQQIQQELANATADRINKQANYELAKNSPADALPDVLNDAALQNLRARVDESTRQVASLNALYNSGYPKLKQAQAELASLRAAYNQQRSDLLSKIKEDFNSAVRRENLLSKEYNLQAREVAGQDERTVEYNMLKREVDSNRQLYDTIMQQTKQASIATALHASNVRVIAPAYLEDKPVSPNVLMNAALGLLLGLFGSVAYVFARENADRTLRNPGELKLWTALPELGSIPRYIERPRAPRLRIGSAKTPLPAVPVPVNDAFQAALTSILLTADTKSGSRVLVFTSAEPSDGKTSVVSNVAIAAARIGKRVLLVDADLRRPRVHELFGLHRENGLSDLISVDAPIGPTTLDEVVQQCSIPGLSVMSAGTPGIAAVHRFYSGTFASLLRDCRQTYDLILLDTPPALHVSDARIIARQADGVILVARAEQTTRDAFLALRNRFVEDSTRVLGCILNDWDPKRSARAYPYYSSEANCA